MGLGEGLDVGGGPSEASPRAGIAHATERRNRLIVDDDKVEDPATQIPLSEAVQIQADFEVGEEVSEAVKFSDFGRRNRLRPLRHAIGEASDVPARFSASVGRP